MLRCANFFIVMKKLFLLLVGAGMLFTARTAAQPNNKLIKFQDEKTQKICINLRVGDGLTADANSDRELSYEEAAAVINLYPSPFIGKEITTFNELKYFKGLKSIPNYAFKDCISLISVIIPDSVTSIGKEAFANCTSLTNVIIPDSVTSIGRMAFANCTSLTSVTIGNHVTSIDYKVFEGCSSLKEVYYTGDLSAWCKIDSKGRLLSPAIKFYINGAELTDITIPSDITEIKKDAFRMCVSLTSVTIPNSVTSIGESAFNYCTSLTSVTIGNSVTSIGQSAFSSCKSLTEVYCKPTTPPTINNSIFGLGRGLKIYVPRNSVDTYKSAEVWNQYADYIEGYDF